MSERWIDHVANVAPQNRRIDRWKLLSAPAEFVKRDGWPWEAGELGDGRAGVGDRQPLPALSALDDLAAPVAEVTDRDISHALNVSRVRQGSDVSSFASSDFERGLSEDWPDWAIDAAQ